MGGEERVRVHGETKGVENVAIEYQSCSEAENSLVDSSLHSECSYFLSLRGGF